ncbi:MAG: 3-alpha,7-alpha,12-alpha-trihydroxy-5-beta-cholest-24-enoyl-CoA hydratase [Deltaproteobacteria bacterium]|nr:3-alpha,7-alpha,12-alpha-trihydroxy-5-beta-cholest-24-enoyl-CoA hydratase [Deltaproteobacteria bacterium]MBT4642544.1 3-alpha,7-alpha,12-alpha-trihydroxy-5-beta-cholest-24-enoyl-CoA hydratase [Deltaproteobacteria bacterium]MBT6501941.1 3-alpha,7-alpha,12-alpha-trihydroxy-5-beta-cholest-24-enoyl-CoA hydratase [Deltaproteobacteria bacterium]
MAINLDVIGKSFETTVFNYNPDTLILYALGLGASVDELDFVYEKNLKAFPTFAVVPFLPALLNVFVPEANLNMFAVLHGEQKIILRKPIATSGTITTSLRCDSIYDKGDSGAIVNLSLESCDASGEVVFENKAVLVDRKGGNFGGDRGPKTEKVEPPEGKTPDFTVEQTTSVDQTALYRLSGDKNPLHIDPTFANKGGFDRPILHGLCSFGIAGKALVHEICGSDPVKLKSFSVRFMNVAYPGDKLKTVGWKIDDGKYIIRTTNQDGKIILGNAVAETNS